MEKGSVICIHNGVLFSHEKNKILSLVTTWMNLEGMKHPVGKGAWQGTVHGVIKSQTQLSD